MADDLAKLLLSPDAIRELEKPEHDLPSMRELGRADRGFADKVFLKLVEGLAAGYTKENSQPGDKYGLDLRLYNDVVNKGRNARITENDLAPWEREAFSKIARDKAVKRKRPHGGIVYQDYKDSIEDGSGSLSNALGGHAFQVFDDSTLNYEAPDKGGMGFTPPILSAAKKGKEGSRTLNISPQRIKQVGGGYGYKFRNDRTDTTLQERPERASDIDASTPEPEVEGAAPGWALAHKVVPPNNAIPVSIASHADFGQLLMDHPNLRKWWAASKARRAKPVTLSDLMTGN